MAIERNHTLIAQIMPPQRTMTATQALAGLALPMLTLALAQANAWIKDSREEDSKAEHNKERFGDAVRDPWA